MVQRLQRIPRCPAHLEVNDLSDGVGVTIYASGQLNVNSRLVRLKAMLHSKNTWRRRQELRYLACSHQVVVPSLAMCRCSLRTLCCVVSRVTPAGFKIKHDCLYLFGRLFGKEQFLSCRLLLCSLRTL